MKLPPFRKLRGYAFDPSLSLRIDTAFINEIVYKVPWEDNLSEGPIGEYVEVVDYDPTVEKFYCPVDLNNRYILAQDGLSPSESNPHFHQQMVYAVAMTTIKNFESALGRKIMWSPRRVPPGGQGPNAGKPVDRFEPRLRIYPHALRDANAYYSPEKRALMFGYFSANPADDTVQMPNALVFTCLSHDIIAHETTHAILDGMFRGYLEGSNPDVLAFHEAFADIVALFQHFTFSEVLKSQIAKTRGDLAAQSLLGQLAQEFGTAIGSYGALRDAIGYVDKKTKRWVYREPSSEAYRTAMEPHERGSILVAAVFEAFLIIYKSRVADLLRIASGGTGILPQGELHPDLVNRLADEAAKTAGHVLKMCVRALDYCPPVDITFGDYLRAIITADQDLVADDSRDYRLAFVDAFRKRGIYPAGVRNLSIGSLCYPRPNISQQLEGPIGIINEFLRGFRGALLYKNERQEIFDITRDYIAGDEGINSLGLHERLDRKLTASPEFQALTGLIFCPQWSKLGVRTSYAHDGPSPSFEVQSLKLASRTGPSGTQMNQIILTLVQRAKIVSVNNGNVVPLDTGSTKKKEEDHFVMQGGCTLIFDLDTLTLKYAIAKPLLDLHGLRLGQYRIDYARASAIYKQVHQPHAASIYQAYFGNSQGHEPFAMLHNH